MNLHTSVSEQSEVERLQALDKLNILDSPREKNFDLIAKLIKSAFDMPIAIVSVIDAHRQWYKAVEGLDNSEVDRKQTFCERLVYEARPLIVKDATRDERFAANPLVLGAPGIRFYAGVPLLTSDGHVVGSLCAIDRKPREFGARQLETLLILAEITMEQLLLRAQTASPPSMVTPADQAAAAGTKSSKRRVLKAGQIVFNDKSSTIDCTVRTLSEAGADLQVNSSAGIPPQFTLRIRADNLAPSAG